MQCFLIFSVTLILSILDTASVFAMGVEKTNSNSSFLLHLNHGEIGVLESIDEPTLNEIEISAPPFELYGFSIRPALGYAYSAGGTEYSHVKFLLDYWLNNHWAMTVFWGVGYFKDSEQINLGLDMEFVSGIELAYIFDNKIRVGLQTSHLSNGGISNENPGVETVSLALSIPLSND